MIHEERIESFIHEADKMHKIMMQDFAQMLPAELVSHLSTVCVYIASSGAMLAEAKLMLKEQLNEIIENGGKGLSELKATAKKDKLSYMTRRTLYAIDKLDTIYHGLTNQGHNIRKVLSYYTTEMSNLPS